LLAHHTAELASESMTNQFEVSTPRLVLLGADEALLRAELEGPEAFALAANATVPAAWPPEHHDRGVIDWVLGSIDSLGADEPWRFYYIVLRNPRTLVGTCGIKQAPDANGCIELGYSVLEQFRCRGIASEAVIALMDVAFARGAAEVAAETFPSLPASIRVMEKCGMTKTGEGSEPGTVRYSKRQ
jgi:RimJ/RimL family protein N-acetyltransferase